MLEHGAKITDNFCYAIRSHSRATANQHLRCSKEGKQDMKEDKGKSIMHTLLLLRMAKKHLLGQNNIE